MRDKADFIENLKMAHVHLMILMEDIKYPLPEERQTCLDYAYRLIHQLIQFEMQDDLQEVLKTSAK